MTGKAELCYECVTADNSYGNTGTVFCFKSKYVEYSQYCPSAEWCFGCVGLKRVPTPYLIKYSKEEYEILHARIVEHMKNTGEWGEFFHTGQARSHTTKPLPKSGFRFRVLKSSRADIFGVKIK